MNLQPLRVEAGWHVSYNQLYELDPVEGNEAYFDGSSLLVLINDLRLTLIDVEWRPERDLNGTFQITVLNFVEHFDPGTNEFRRDPNWDTPHSTFSTSSRKELVRKLEELMRTLPIYKDPRMTVKRGLVDEPSESYRLELLENGLSPELVRQILEHGGPSIQSLVLDHQGVTQEIIQQFVENGITKKVRNKAQQKRR